MPNFEGSSFLLSFVLSPYSKIWTVNHQFDHINLVGKSFYALISSTLTWFQVPTIIELCYLGFNWRVSFTRKMTYSFLWNSSLKKTSISRKISMKLYPTTFSLSHLKTLLLVLRNFSKKYFLTTIVWCSLKTVQTIRLASTNLISQAFLLCERINASINSKRAKPSPNSPSMSVVKVVKVSSYWSIWTHTHTQPKTLKSWPRSNGCAAQSLFLFRIQIVHHYGPG